MLPQVPALVFVLGGPRDAGECKGNQGTTVSEKGASRCLQPRTLGFRAQQCQATVWDTGPVPG